VARWPALPPAWACPPQACSPSLRRIWVRRAHRCRPSRGCCGRVSFVSVSLKDGARLSAPSSTQFVTEPESSIASFDSIPSFMGFSSKSRCRGII
jgi:hypothetical protein